VAATSASNAWAVGTAEAPAPVGTAHGTHTLILHWNGKAWANFQSANELVTGNTGNTGSTGK
jgi:hypothetical protein